jgi:hypothetical protein
VAAGPGVQHDQHRRGRDRDKPDDQRDASTHPKKRTDFEVQKVPAAQQLAEGVARQIASSSVVLIVVAISGTLQNGAQAPAKSA